MYLISAPPCPARFPLRGVLTPCPPPLVLTPCPPPFRPPPLPPPPPPPPRGPPPPPPPPGRGEGGNYGLPTRDRSDHEKRLRPRRNGIGKRGVRRAVNEEERKSTRLNSSRVS